MRLQLEAGDSAALHPATRWGKGASILVTAGAAALLLQDCLRGIWHRDLRLERNHGSRAAMAAAAAPPAVPPAAAAAASPPAVQPAAAATIATPQIGLSE